MDVDTAAGFLRTTEQELADASRDFILEVARTGAQPLYRFAFGYVKGFAVDGIPLRAFGPVFLGAQQALAAVGSEPIIRLEELWLPTDQLDAEDPRTPQQRWADHIRDLILEVHRRGQQPVFPYAFGLIGRHVWADGLPSASFTPVFLGADQAIAKITAEFPASSIA